MAAFLHLWEEIKMKDREKLQICPLCETGRKDYMLDKQSIFCSYIGCLKDGNCTYFVPLLMKSK